MAKKKKVKKRLIKDLRNKDYIISIDLALAKSGWSVYDLKTKKIIDYGIFVTKPNKLMGERLRTIHGEIRKIQKMYPNYHIIKETMPLQNAFTTIKTLQGLAMSHAIALLLSPLADDVHPLSIKSVVRKYMGADSKTKTSKDEVRYAMNEIYGLDIKDNDISDSIGVLYTFKIKFDKEIDEDIKQIRKKIKTLSTQTAIDKNIKLIKDLENRKINI